MSLSLLLLIFTQDIHFSVLKNIAISKCAAKNQSKKIIIIITIKSDVKIYECTCKRLVEEI